MGLELIPVPVLRESVTKLRENKKKGMGGKLGSSFGVKASRPFHLSECHGSLARMAGISSPGFEYVDRSSKTDICGGFVRLLI